MANIGFRLIKISFTAAIWALGIEIAVEGVAALEPVGSDTGNEPCSYYRPMRGVIIFEGLFGPLWCGGAEADFIDRRILIH